MHGATIVDFEVRAGGVHPTEIQLQGAFQLKFPSGNWEILTSRMHNYACYLILERQLNWLQLKMLVLLLESHEPHFRNLKIAGLSFIAEEGGV